MMTHQACLLAVDIHGTCWPSGCKSSSWAGCRRRILDDASCRVCLHRNISSSVRYGEVEKEMEDVHLLVVITVENMIFSGIEA